MQAVVIVEAQRLVLNHPAVQNKARGLQPLFGAGVAGIQNGHIILFRHGVDGAKQGQEILLRVDVFLPVGRQQNVLSLGQSQPLVDVRSLDGV